MSFLRKEECEKISALLTACHLLEGEVTTNELAWLKPTFVLIGSVAEGTRLEKASEIDLTVKFKNLREQPLVPSKSDLDLHVPNDSPMRRFTKDNGTYDHVAFLSHFIDAIKNGLVRASQSDDWPESLSFNLEQWQPCPECLKISNSKRTSVYSPQYHCQNCLPAVAHTKVGPCLVLKWKGKVTVTADLIPVFPVSSQKRGVLGLFNTVTQSLLKKKPDNWLQHFYSIIERDRILPESLGRAMATSGNHTVHQVAIKLLNYNPKDNYVIRPGQGMNTLDLRRSGPLRGAYTCIKVLKELCQANVKTYVIKKVMLSPDIKAKLEDEDMHTIEGAFVVLSHPELKKHFSKIDFKKWAKNINIMHQTHTWDRDNQIPIVEKAWEHQSEQ